MSDGIILAMPLGGDMHVTVLYFGTTRDEDQIDAETLHALLRPVDGPQTAVATRTAHFGPDDHGTAFVHELDSPSLVAAYNQAKAIAGPLVRSSYPDFKPHVTLAYHKSTKTLPDAGTPVHETYSAPGLEIWYGGEHYPLADPFPTSTSPMIGDQRDPYWAGFTASGVEEFYSPLQRRARDGKWTKGGGGGAGPNNQGKPGRRPGMGDVALDVIDLEAPGSIHTYLKNGKWTPERQAVHDKIIEEALAGLKGVDHPTMTMLGGGGGSGKSTLLKSNPDLAPHGAVTVDPDGLKAKLPEHGKREDWAAHLHEESSYLAARLALAAQERKIPIVLDGVGNSNPGKVQRKIDQAREHGYGVKAVYVTVPTQVAIDRAAARAAKTGRVVPESALKSAHASVSRVLPEVSHMFDSTTLWDTTGTPKLIATAKRGEALKPEDPELFQQFLAKAAS